MRSTRRAALAVLAGSGTLLAVETLGLSRGRLERDAAVEPSADAGAYLGLTADGVETGGLLFGDGAPRPAPAGFDVTNQLPEPIAVDLSANSFAFSHADGGTTFAHADGAAIELASGERTAVAVDLVTAPDGPGGVTDAIEIAAEGAANRIEAVRSLTLVPRDLAFVSTLCRGVGGPCVDVEVRLAWTGDAVAVDVVLASPDGTERERAVRAVEPADSTAVDFDLGPYGSGRSGRWIVTGVRPDPADALPDATADTLAGVSADAVAGGLPGAPVRFAAGGVSIEVDPDASDGADERVGVTIAFGT